MKQAIVRASVLTIISTLFVTVYTFAQNKVVVVPLSGDAGIGGYEVVSDDSASLLIGTGSGIAHQALCPPGKKVLGGGVESNHDNALTITANRPLVGSDDGWRGVVVNMSSNTLLTTLTIYAICANPT